MTAHFALKLFLLALIPGFLGWFIRKSLPRLAMFLLGLPTSAVGLWMAISTLELASVGKAHSFSRHATVFSREALPDYFQWSLWFHLILGGFVIVAGLLAMVLPLTPYGARIKFER